jgi:hypothetical protein
MCQTNQAFPLVATHVLLRLQEEWSKNMVDFVICLGWGILCFYYALLVRIGAKPVPKPPELGRTSPASYVLDFISNQDVQYPILYS